MAGAEDAEGVGGKEFCVAVEIEEFGGLWVKVFELTRVVGVGGSYGSDAKGGESLVEFGSLVEVCFLICGESICNRLVDFIFFAEGFRT